MPLPKTGNYGRPKTARQEKPAKAKIVTGGDGKKMVGKKMARQGKGVAPSSPRCRPGVKIVTTYSQAPLIQRAIHTLTEKLLEEPGYRPALPPWDADTPQASRP